MTPKPVDRPQCPKCGQPQCVIRTRISEGFRIQTLGCRGTEKRPCNGKFWSGPMIMLPVDTKTTHNDGRELTNTNNGYHYGNSTPHH